MVPIMRIAIFRYSLAIPQGGAYRLEIISEGALIISNQ